MSIQIKVVQRIVGILLTLFSSTMLVPIIVAYIYKDGAVVPFIDAFTPTFLSGILMYWPVRHHQASIRIRDGFLIVVLFWTVLSVFGSLPFYMYPELKLSLAASIFESMSGLTATGATYIVGLDQLPHSILFYRQQLQWLGGMGIVVLAIAILPMLGIGGMKLYRAESTGPSKNKLTPRIASTAKALWYIYLAITIACAVAFKLAGMTTFDAITHSFATVATGGSSTHDASFGYFDSTTIEMIAVVFMLLSGANFALHFIAWRNRSVKDYWLDEEFRAYVIFLIMVTVITTLYLYFSGTSGALTSLLDALFHVVSIETTTGFTTEAYYNWPSFLPVLLLLSSVVGGCAGSTSGGMKVVRVLLLLKQGRRELQRMLHPNAKLLIKLGGRSLPGVTIDVVWGFLATYLALATVMMLLLMAAGLDQDTAFSAVLACMNNMGPGLGAVAANYSELGSFSLSVLCFAMLFGRLELFTLLILFTPDFWRR